jgi:hypothetical protein
VTSYNSPASFLWEDFLQHYPVLVVPARTKYWYRQNVGACQDFTDFRQTLAVNISSHRHPIKNGKSKKLAGEL